MPTIKPRTKSHLPRDFPQLVRQMPPRAIMDEVDYRNSLERVDQIMSIPRLSKGQKLYLETLVQLVQAYEAAHYDIEVSDISGIDLLKHLLAENQMNASDLARLLDVHPTMGSKILAGDRSLTVEHVKKLAGRFKISPEAFIS